MDEFERLLSKAENYADISGDSDMSTAIWLLCKALRMLRSEAGVNQ